MRCTYYSAFCMLIGMHCVLCVSFDEVEQIPLASRKLFIQAFSDPHVRALLDMISYCEGTSYLRRNKACSLIFSSERCRPYLSDYKILFTGKTFDSFNDHPDILISSSSLLGRVTLSSTAAGRYQFLSRVWDEVFLALKSAFYDYGFAKKYIFNSLEHFYPKDICALYPSQRYLFEMDFGPVMQDLGAIYMIYSRGLLKKILDGDFDFVVLQKLAKVWAGLPCKKRGNHSCYKNQYARCLYKDFMKNYWELVKKYKKNKVKGI